MVPPSQQDEQYRRYAEDVLAHYTEITTVASSNSASAIYRRIASGGTGINTGGNAGGWFKPIQSDFIADVEILARKFLAPSEYKLFRYVYIDHPDWTIAQSDQPKLDLMHLKLGRTFEKHGLWPVSAYFRPQDMRRGQK